jgi:hypothetical protein
MKLLEPQLESTVFDGRLRQSRPTTRSGATRTTTMSTSPYRAAASGLPSAYVWPVYLRPAHHAVRLRPRHAALARLDVDDQEHPHRHALIREGTPSMIVALGDWHT